MLFTNLNTFALICYYIPLTLRVNDNALYHLLDIECNRFSGHSQRSLLCIWWLRRWTDRMLTSHDGAALRSFRRPVERGLESKLTSELCYLWHSDVIPTAILSGDNPDQSSPCKAFVSTSIDVRYQPKML